MYKLTLKILLFLNSLTMSWGNNIRYTNRLLKSENVVSDKIKCIEFNNTCNCPGECMSIKEQYCIIDNCWEWDKNLGCSETGPNYNTALILQAVPFTGIFGAGFGNIGRWDLFGIGSILWGLGSIFPCVILCLYLTINIEGNPIDAIKRYLYLFLFLVLCYWIWGLYLIGSRQVYSKDGCKLI
jgi:hypothetical protein